MLSADRLVVSTNLIDSYDVAKNPTICKFLSQAPGADEPTFADEQSRLQKYRLTEKARVPLSGAK